MTKFSDVIEEVLSHLYSFGSSRDKVTALSGAITGSVTVLAVDDGKQIDRGYIEIDQEMIQVNTVDPSSGTVTLFPFSRGSRGTVAATHLAGAMVTCNPRFPRNRVAKEINEVINSLYPDLFDIAVFEGNVVNPSRVTYPLPADCQSVVDVTFQTTGPSLMWAPVTRYKMDFSADTTAFPTGKSLDIYGAMQPGRTMKIRYRRALVRMVNESDDMQTVGYVRDEWIDIVRMMTVARLLMSLEPVRLELDAFESAARSAQPGGVQPTAATSVAKQMLGFAQSRLAAERKELLLRYPSTQVRLS